MVYKLILVPFLFTALSTAVPPTYSPSSAVEVLERDVSTAVDPLSISPWMKHSFAGLSTDVSGPTPEVDAGVAGAAFKALTGITQAVCGTGNAPGCISIAAASLFIIAITLWKKRDLDPMENLQVEYMPGFAPTSSCSGLCPFRASVPKNGNLTHVSYVTINGTRHEMHFAHGGVLGNLEQLRSYQATTSDGVTKRYQHDEASQGGIVADYWFNDINYNDWEYLYNKGSAGRGAEAAEATNAGQFISNLMWSQNSMAACMSEYKSGTDAFHGVVSVGWNGQAFVWGSGGAPDMWAAYTQGCGYPDNN